jgi:hypothetical protein
MKGDKTAVDAQNYPLTIDSCCWGNIGSLSGRLLANNSLDKFKGIELTLTTKTHYRSHYELTVDRRKLVDQIFTELRFDEWLDGLITKTYAKDGTVNSILFKPECSIPLMVTASSVYRLSANCSYFVATYNTARKGGIRPMLAYFIASNIASFYDSIYDGGRRSTTYGMESVHKKLLDVDPKYIIRAYRHHGHMPFDSYGMSIKTIQLLESLSTEEVQNNWPSMYSVLNEEKKLDYTGRTEYFTPSKQVKPRPFAKILGLKNTWEKRTNTEDSWAYQGYTPSELPHEYVLDDVLQAALKLQETKL